MGKFIYALNEQEREELLKLGFEELGSCKINGQNAYSFDNSTSKIATFSKENQCKYLVTDVAFFV